MSKLSQTIAILGVVAGLGITAVPMTTYAADPTDRVYDGSTDDLNTDSSKVQSKPTTVSLEVTNELSIATDSAEVELNATNGFRGDVKISVISTAETYGLYIKGDDKLTGTGTGAAHPILALTAAGPLAPTATDSTWGYRWNSASNASEDFNGVTSSLVKVYDGAKTDFQTADENTVTFGAGLIATQENDTYTGDVTFTAISTTAE